MVGLITGGTGAMAAGLTQVGSWPEFPSSAAVAVAVESDTVYLLMPNNGLVSCDITDPAAPGFTGYLGLPDDGRSGEGALCLSGDRLYVTGALDLWVVDVSDPADLRLEGHAVIENGLGAYGPRRCVPAGDYLLIGGSEDWLGMGFQVWDVSGPAQPVPASTLALSGAADVAVVGSLAYVAGTPRAHVVDLSDPLHPGTPVKLAYLPRTIEAVAANETTAFMAAGDSGVVVDDHGLYVLDLTADPIQPPIIAHVDQPVPATCMALQGDLLFISSSENGLQIWDVQDRANPVLLGSLQENLRVSDMVLREDTAFLCTREWGLVLADVSNPAQPTVRSMLPIPHGWLGRFMSTRDGLLCVADDRSDVLHLVDMSNPTEPRHLSTLLRPAPELSGLGLVQMDDKRLWAVGSSNAPESAQLWTWDITTPTSPVLLGSIPLPVGDLDYAVAGDLLFDPDAEGFFNILDTSDFPNVESLSATDLGARVTSFFVRERAGGERLAILTTTDPARLRILDITDPGRPVERGALDVPVPTVWSWVSVVEGNDDFCLVFSDQGMSVDISDPDAPRMIGEVALPRHLLVEGSGRYAAAGAGGSTCEVFDLRDLANPVVVSVSDLGASPTWVQGWHEGLLITNGGSRGNVLFWQFEPPGAGAPSFVWGPALSETRYAGMTFDYRVEATGAGLSFQWLRDGVPIQDSERVSGAQTSQLHFTSVAGAESGAYSCEVTNEHGMLRSPPAALEVVPFKVGVTLQAPTNLQVWWNTARYDGQNVTPMLQTTTDLFSGEWVDTGDVIPNHSGDPTKDGAARFYRLVIPNP
ncbi:MAG: hypothetical protein H7A46_18265 [Verrucomicrobiales bacterium]|nr:hypothetical protein [Verrucomicrobiales bacterium]